MFDGIQRNYYRSRGDCKLSMMVNTDRPDSDFCARDQFGQKDGTVSLVEHAARFLAALVSSSKHAAQCVLNMAHFN